MEKTLSITTLLTLSTLLIPSAHSESSHHKDHSHGHGVLNIALEGQQLNMELKMPVYDTLGFEKITTKAQQSILKRALNTLESKNIWILPAKSNCILIDAKASIRDTGHQGNDDSHDHASAHMDISSTYSYKCEKPAAITNLKTTLFNHFKRSRAIFVQIITSRGQRSVKLSRNNPRTSF